MDEVSRTLDAYESDADTYVEKYRDKSIAVQYGDEFFDALQRNPGSLEGKKVLDLGCGPGPDVGIFVSAGYDAVGLDLTASFLREARKQIPAASFVRGDMRHLPFQDDTFDGIWGSASFHHVPRPAALSTLGGCRRVLREGGVVYLSVKRVGYEPRDERDRHFEYYRADEFRGLFEDAGFERLDDSVDENWVSVLARVA